MVVCSFLASMRSNFLRCKLEIIKNEMNTEQKWYRNVWIQMRIHVYRCKHLFGVDVDAVQYAYCYRIKWVFEIKPKMPFYYWQSHLCDKWQAPLADFGFYVKSFALSLSLHLSLDCHDLTHACALLSHPQLCLEIKSFSSLCDRCLHLLCVFVTKSGNRHIHQKKEMFGYSWMNERERERGKQNERERSAKVS